MNMLRTIRTTHGIPDVDDAAAEQLEELIEKGQVLRETYQEDEIGQKEYLVKVVSFVEAGQERYAVFYADPASVEIEDTNDRADAERYYEETVQFSWSNMSPGDELFDASDVPGVGVRHP